MLPIHAFIADVDCPPGVPAVDRFAEVGSVFIDWVEGAFAEDAPAFSLPTEGTSEPVPGHAVRVETDTPDAAHERFRITWRQPWLADGCVCVHEYAVARAGETLSASVAWHLVADGNFPPDAGQPDHPAILDRLRPFVSDTILTDRHPLDGLARRDRGRAFRAVEAAIAGQRAAAERERAAFYEEMERENLALTAQRDELLLEVDELNETVYDQRSQILALSERRPRANGTTARPFEPTSVSAAVDRAREEFGQELLFLKSADESAADSPYRYPERAYELLHALGEITRLWRTDALGKDWHDAFLEYNPRFKYKPKISQTTATNNWEDYAFLYDGAKRLFEPHISLGKSHDPKKCLSVHWIRDDAARKVIVGWCGRHLPNTMS